MEMRKLKRVKYNCHISKHKGLKRYLGFLRRNLVTFAEQYKEHNNMDSTTLWVDFYEKGDWNMTKKDIKRNFNRLFSFGCRRQMQPEVVAKLRNSNDKIVLVVFRMNISWELKQNKDKLKDTEYTFLYLMVKYI